MKRSEIICNDLEYIYKSFNEWEQLRNTTLLISGAYGMLASYIIMELLFLNEHYNYNIRIVALVKSKQKFLEKFSSFSLSYVEILESDLTSGIKISLKIDYIIHAASLASPQYYSVCPVDVLAPNIFGTKYLLDLAIEHKVKAFLFFSTGDIYGFPIRKDIVSEDDYGYMNPLDIHSCYGESKRMAETMCISYLKQFDVPVKIARIWHSYGPTMDIKTDPRVFSSFVKDIIEKRDIVMYSNGESKRCFTYISDATIAFFTILLKGIVGEAYNVCNSSQLYSIKNLAQLLVNLFPEYKLKVVHKNRAIFDKYIENNLAPIDYPIPSNLKLKDLGWTPNINVQDGFKKVIDFFLMASKERR